MSHFSVTSRDSAPTTEEGGFEGRDQTLSAVGCGMRHMLCYFDSAVAALTFSRGAG